MTRCQCLTKNGKGPQCKNPPTQGDFCTTHQACQNRFVQTQQTVQTHQTVQKREIGMENLGEAQIREIAKHLPIADVAKMSQVSKHLNRGLKAQLAERKPAHIWITVDDDNVPVSAHSTKAKALQGGLKLMRPDYLQDALDAWEVTKPIDWTNSKIVHAIEDLLAEENIAIVKLVIVD